MDLEIFEVFKNNKLEVILIGLGAFLLTYLIKWPIKKQTAKLAEEKRKMVNIIIIFIPLILSAVASVVFYGITTREWISWIVVDCSISAWLISLSLYAVVSRIAILIRGLRSGKVKLNSELTKDTIKYIKEIDYVGHVIPTRKSTPNCGVLFVGLWLELHQAPPLRQILLL